VFFKKNRLFKDSHPQRYCNPFKKVNIINKELVWNTTKDITKAPNSIIININSKLYRNISHFTPYKPDLPLVDDCDSGKKPKGNKFMISSHTVSNS
jgi:hypothetical protein